MRTSKLQRPPLSPRLQRVRRSAPREGGTPKAPRIRIVGAENTAAVDRLLEPGATRSLTLERVVTKIVRDVRVRGDRAVLEYAVKFDQLEGSIEISPAEMRSAAKGVPRDVREAIRLASRNIATVARKQVPRAWRVNTVPGVTIEQRVTPLDRVGCYVPAGRYPLPSSLLMTAIPARVAGVGEIIAVCPRPDATVMLAAVEAGVDRMLRIGGAHAIAALAYGTSAVPRVDRIVGPGSAYVAAAKALVSRDCAIDFFAGPSEIVVVSAAGRPDWIAADLIAQAEHDEDARAILITPSRRLATAVASELERQLPAAGIASDALRRNGGIIVTHSMNEAIALCQRAAPEHVVCDDQRCAAKLTRAGTVFVGSTSAQALGDYVTGSNHVLPTSGAASARGGLSAADFVRVSSVQTVTSRGLARIGPPAARLARAEGLEGHAMSIDVRLGASR